MLYGMGASLHSDVRKFALPHITVLLMPVEFFWREWANGEVDCEPCDLGERIAEDASCQHEEARHVGDEIPRWIWPREEHEGTHADEQDEFDCHEIEQIRADEVVAFAAFEAQAARGTVRTQREEAREETASTAVGAA